MRILFFGITKDITGKREFNDYPLPSIKTVEGLLEDLKTQYPDLSKLSSVAVGVNQQYASMETELGNDDVVALIPPVSGG